MADNQAHRVLFIGNSYTHFNEMPTMVEQLAAAAGYAPKLAIAQVTNGGYTLQRHWREKTALMAVRQGGWLQVVLQEQSLRPIQDPERMVEDVCLFAEEIRAQDAELLLYAPWARRNRPDTHEAITAAYEEAGSRCGARLVRVGDAWRRALAELPHLRLHKPDNSHPNAIGSYLTACVFLAVLTGASPVGLPHALRVEGERWAGAEQELADLPDQDALALQRIALGVTNPLDEARDR